MIELIFIIASVLLSIGTFLFYRIQKEYRYKKWLYIRIGLIVSMALMGFAIYFSFFNVNGTDDEYVNQIEKLEKAQKSLDDLDEYIESQKELIKKNETYIDKLSKKKKNLEEVVKTKQETADALFREFENRYQKRKWTERIISFIIGLITTLIGVILTNPPKKRFRLKLSKSKEKSDVTNYLLYDNFNVFQDWHDYKKGTISQTNEISPKSGRFCVKKHRNNDPSGGFKLFDNSIDTNIETTGFIYRPSGFKGGQHDRVSIENKNHNGYGFCYGHNNKNIQLEKRINGNPNAIGNKISVEGIDLEQWYSFSFKILEKEIILLLFNSKNEKICELKEIIEEKFSGYDRFVIHGGHSYYLDDIKVTKIQT